MNKLLLTITVTVLTLISSYLHAIQVYVKIIPSNKTIILDLLTSDSVQNIKQKIQLKEGISPINQHVYYEGKQLQDGRLAADYNISANSYLIMVMKDNKSVLSVATNGTFNVKAGTIVSTEKLTLKPTSNYTFNSSLEVSYANANYVKDPSLSYFYKDYSFIVTPAPFSGEVKVAYSDFDSAYTYDNALKLLYYNGDSWNLDTTSTNNATLKTVSTSITNKVLKKITLGNCDVTNSVSQIINCGPYLWNNVNYTQSGIYTFTTKTKHGCDSVATLNLTIKNQTSSTEIISKCGSYTWTTNGQTYTQSGIYNVVLMNAQGCDSIVTLNLTIKSVTTKTESITTCGTYTWLENGQSYAQSGTYTTTLVNAAGCDSIITLNLTITDLSATISTSSPTTVCQGISVLLNATTGNGFTYIWKRNNIVIAGATNASYSATISGNYEVEISNSTGCKNSSAKTLVTVNTKPAPVLLAAPLTSTGKIAICPQTSITIIPSVAGGVWSTNNPSLATVANGVVTGVAGGKVIISYTLTNSNGCSSTTSKTIDVDLRPTTPVIYGTNIALCQSGKAFLTASVPNGKWSTIDSYLKFSILNNGMFYQQTTIPVDNFTSGVKYTVSSTNRACTSEATKVILLRKLPQKAVTITASSTNLTVNQQVTATAATTMTGIGTWRSFLPVSVSVTVHPTNNKLSTVKGLAIGTNGYIMFQAKDLSSGCTNGGWLSFNVITSQSMVAVTNTASTTTRIHLYPNPSNGRFTIENSEEATEIKLVDITGRIIATQGLTAGTTIVDFSGVTAGKYMVHITGESMNEIQPIVIE